MSSDWKSKISAQHCLSRPEHLCHLHQSPLKPDPEVGRGWKSLIGFFGCYMSINALQYNTIPSYLCDLFLREPLAPGFFGGTRVRTGPAVCISKPEVNDHQEGFKPNNQIVRKAP